MVLLLFLLHVHSILSSFLSARDIHNVDIKLMNMKIFRCTLKESTKSKRWIRRIGSGGEREEMNRYNFAVILGCCLWPQRMGWFYGSFFIFLSNFCVYGNLIDVLASCEYLTNFCESNGIKARWEKFGKGGFWRWFGFNFLGFWVKKIIE